MTELRERKMERVQASQRDAATTVQRLSGLWAASAARISAELKAAFRDWQSMLFNMALPVLMMIVFGSVFKGKIEGTNVDYRVMFIAGMIAVGIMSACFQTLAIGVTLDRDEGLIRRLAASPMMRPAYFVGIMVKTLVMTLLEVVIIVGLGVVLYNLTDSDGSSSLVDPGVGDPSWSEFLLACGYCVHRCDPQCPGGSSGGDPAVHDSPADLGCVLPLGYDPRSHEVHRLRVPAGVDGEGAALRLPARLSRLQ